MITNKTKQKIHDLVYDNNFDKILDSIVEFSFRNFNEKSNYNNVIETINETINEFLDSELIFCMSNVLTPKMVGFTICDSILDCILGEITRKYGHDYICNLYKQKLKPYLIEMKIDRINGDF